MTRPHRFRQLLPAVAAVLALASCSGGGEAGEAAAASSPPSAADPASAGGAAATSEPASEAADDEPLATDPPRPEATDVVLTLASWDAGAGAVIASGYVSPVVEDGGSCVLELTLDGETRTATTGGLADASTTVCGGLQVPGDDLAAGTWTAVLRYVSASSSGESEALAVEVPA